MTHGKIDVVLIGHNALNFDVLDRMFNSDTKTSPRLGLQELVQSQLLMKEWRINLRFDNRITFEHQRQEARMLLFKKKLWKKASKRLHQREEKKVCLPLKPGERFGQSQRQNRQHSAQSKAGANSKKRLSPRLCRWKPQYWTDKTW